ncbi:Mitochondrial import inner membrane translocase subunit TIM8 [Spatholobus suberectus]|nr:Mitochondrial import inner membrane translocase subunit TIM8 [Spatholobus suberectus]
MALLDWFVYFLLISAGLKVLEKVSDQSKRVLGFIAPFRFACGIRVFVRSGSRLLSVTLSMDLSELNSAEMQKFYSEEQQRAMVNEMVAKLTSACWDKCITGTPGNKFSSSEYNCLSNCAQRYLEMSMLVMKRFQGMQ